MTLYTWHDRPQDFPEPVLVVQLDGWIDAGLGAAAAMAALLGSLDTQVVATFDTDTLLDHRARRPVLHLVDGVNTGLSWPVLELRAAHDRDGRPLLILTGPEPDHQWRAFADDVAGLAVELGVRLVVGLGAFPAPVPHTRPCRLAATATTEDLAAQVGFVGGSLDVPAGAMAVLEQRFAAAAIPAVGLWARVPHYLSAMPYPEASAALLEGLARLAGLAVDTDELRRAADEARARITALIANNPEHQQLVEQLEAQVDGDAGNLPSGDEIAAELERYLRDHPG